MTLLFIAVAMFGLASFGFALVYWDRYEKERRRRQLEAKVYEQQLNEFRFLAGYWCCEAIKLEKAAANERDERLRWEKAYADKLSHRVN